MGITLLLEANRLLLSNRGKNFHGNLCSIKSSQLVGSVKPKSFMNFQGNLCGDISCQLMGSFKVQSLIALTRSSVDRHSPQSTQLVHTVRSQKQKPLRDWLKYLAVLVVQSLSLLMLMHCRNSALAFSGNHVTSSSAAPSLRESSPVLPRPEQQQVQRIYCREEQNLPQVPHYDPCSKHVSIYVTLIMFGLMLGLMTDGRDHPRGTVIKLQTASKLKKPPNTFIKLKVVLLYVDEIFENDLNRILKKATSPGGGVFMLKDIIDSLRTQRGYWERFSSFIEVTEIKEDVEKQLKELFAKEQSNTFCSYKRSRWHVVTILVAAECEGHLDLCTSLGTKSLDEASKQLQSICSTSKIQEAKVLFSPCFETVGSKVWIGVWVSTFLRLIVRLRGLIENLFVGHCKETDSISEKAVETGMSRTTLLNVGKQMTFVPNEYSMDKIDSISGKDVETGMSRTTLLNVEKQMTLVPNEYSMDKTTLKSDVLWQTKTIIITSDCFNVIEKTIKEIKDNLTEFFKNSLKESPLCFCFISNISKGSGYTVEFELKYGLDKNKGLEESCMMNDEITKRILRAVKEAGKTNGVQITVKWGSSVKSRTSKYIRKYTYVEHTAEHIWYS